MNKKETIEYLEAEGWKYYSRDSSYFKRFETPTRCECNKDKKGIQVELFLYEFESISGYEIKISGQLKDESWIKLQNYSFEEDLKESLKTIPRLLETWEFISNK